MALDDLSTYSICPTRTASALKHRSLIGLCDTLLRSLVMLMKSYRQLSPAVMDEERLASKGKSSLVVERYA